MKSKTLKTLLLLICFMPLALTSCKDDESVTPTEEGPTQNIFDGNVILSSQVQVDDFAAENYNIIRGDILIGFEVSSTQTSNITDLSQLTSITGITGKLNISNNPILPNIEGLNSLSFVRGFEFRKNSIITTLLPLVNVLELTFLLVEDNDALINLEGLSGVTSIMQYAIIRRNEAMLNLNGLNNLETIEEGFLSVAESPLLDNISALSNLEFIGGTLTINYTPLTTLNGLDNLETLNGDIFMAYNEDLANYCALNTLVIDNSYSGQIVGIAENAFIPTVQDILDENCSQ